jgi:pyridoxal 5'-phosphate synthase pdxT subunit
VTVGVLALQGGFDAHVKALAAAGLPARLVRTAADLDGLDGLVLPGGESPAQLRLIARGKLEPSLRAFAATGRPVLGTCAGLILMARAVTPLQHSLGWLDVAVDRNAYGTQLDSFEAEDDAGTRRLVFIRAPQITDVGPAVEILARFRGVPVLVRQGSFWGAAYHPELEGHALHETIFATRQPRSSPPDRL